MESPQAFITRRTVYTRMLTQINDGGTQEITIVMHKAPIAWRPILNMSTIANSKQLLAHVIEHSKALIAASQSDHNSSKISTPELITALKSLGIDPPHRPRFNMPRSVNLVSNEEETEFTSYESQNLDDYLMNEDVADDPAESLVRSAFQVLKKRQRPAPQQYYFPISDKEMKLGKLPPSPCKVCSSPRHWDKECPYWDKYLEHLKLKTAQLASLQVDENTSPTDMYQMAYQVLVQNKETSGLVTVTECDEEPSFMESNGKGNVEVLLVR